MYLLLKDLALKKLVSQAHIPRSPGCVGGCNACDQSHETIHLLKVAKKAGVNFADMFAPILAKLGDEYNTLYHEIFPSHEHGAPITIYEPIS